MHRSGWTLIAIALGTALAVPAARASSAHVTIAGFQFDPPNVTISAGDSVTWTQPATETMPHSVTFDDGSFDQPAGCGQGLNQARCTAPGSTITRSAWPGPGTYPYYCKIHGGPRGVGMHGTVTVVASTTTRAATTTRPTGTTTRLTGSTTSTTGAGSGSTLAPGGAVGVAEGTTTSTAFAQRTTSGGGNGSGAVIALVAALLAVAAGGGALLWRLRPRA